MRIFLISGISGSGKSVALNVLEDTGFFCVDNLPPTLLPELISTLTQDGIQAAAIAIDARSANSLNGLINSIQLLKAAGHQLDLLFLTAKTESLIARFSETRRSHPLSHRLLPGQNPNDPRTLIECIQTERKMLNEMEEIADVIDTSGLKTSQLRSWIRELINIERSNITILFESFAFKVGVPLNADLMFDVRTLPNPHYDINLRPLTGQDLPVQLFLQDQPEAQEMLNDISQFIEKWLPSFKHDNRSYLTICIGCTGGQHRSVYMVEQLAQHFKTTEQVVIRHRELT
ncbi:RNase adapter RapZ [Solimicrobium silvestre]|uniref:Putative P-loop-containing kinase n=1 Tax=Solimicrobium silvestre TaxID=2099400 RepID=A0A2S9H1D5_9BURK|nr:RNase adapter RapZ [Solimicrobium silvestre]PRC93792.1 putative P-loop-containing kinase [Solimicrobium silvestre]